MPQIFFFYWFTQTPHLLAAKICKVRQKIFVDTPLFLTWMLNCMEYVFWIHKCMTNIACKRTLKALMCTFKFYWFSKYLINLVTYFKKSHQKYAFIMISFLNDEIFTIQNLFRTQHSCCDDMMHALSKEQQKNLLCIKNFWLFCKAAVEGDILKKLCLIKDKGQKQRRYHIKQQCR